MLEFGMDIKEPYDIYVDNTQSIGFSKNITVHSKLRTTFNLKDKRIQEMRDDKIVNAKYVLGIGGSMLADCFFDGVGSRVGGRG